MRVNAINVEIACDKKAVHAYNYLGVFGWFHFVNYPKPSVFSPCFCF